MEKGEGVMYAMTFSLQKELSAPIYATVRFENPSDRKKPFDVELAISPGQEQVLVRSPSISRIKNNRAYKVQVLLFSDEARTQRIGQHKQKVVFSIPSGMEDVFGIDLL